MGLMDNAPNKKKLKVIVMLLLYLLVGHSQSCNGLLYLEN